MQTGAKVCFGPCLTELTKLRLPSGLHLNYPQLEKVPELERLHPDWGVEWRYYKPRYRSFTPLFGAKLVENMTGQLVFLGTVLATSPIVHNTQLKNVPEYQTASYEYYWSYPYRPVQWFFSDAQ